MDVVYIIGGVILIIAVALLLRLRRPSKEKKQQTTDDQSSIQKNKKKKHFGFSKSKNKKTNADAEEALTLELLEKKGKKKAKSKAKATGKKKAAQRAAESHQEEMESDKESLAAEEDNDQNSDIEEPTDAFVKRPAEKPTSTTKQQVTAAAKLQPELGANLPGKSDDGELEKSEGKKKAKKTRPRKEGEDELKKQTSVEAKQVEMTLVIEEKENVAENWKTLNANHDSSPDVVENGELESSAAIGSKAAKKKKKKNKTNANVDIPHATVGVGQADEGRQSVSAEVTVGKPAELEEEDVEDGFVRVTRDPPSPKTGDANAKEVATKPPESESEKALKAALEAELLKCQVLQEQCDGERRQNDYLKQALEQMGLQIQEKEAKKMKLERSLEQLSHELKTLNAHLGENASIAQKLRDENQALKEALSKAQQHAVDEAQKVELQQRVRVMDDALKQNALQLNSIDNARKDLESREKRHLERIVSLERELQASKSELSESHQSAEQQCQVMSAEIQRLTLEQTQVEKMKTCYRELEKQKAEFDRVLQTLKTQNSEFINYRQTKESELQQLQSEMIEISRMNETFQRRSRELEARSSDRDALAAQTDSLRQQLCAKDADLQALVERGAQLEEKKRAEAEELRGFLEQELRLEMTRELGQREAEFLQKEAALSCRIQDLESLDSGRSNVKELEDELSACRTKTQQLVANEAGLLKEVDRLTQELGAVQVKNENLDELKFELAKEVNQLRSDSEAKTNQVAQMEWEKQELKHEVSKLQASLGERDANAENFAQVQADLNQRLEKALLMQQELDKQKKENTVLRDEIEQTKSELLQRLANNDAQLRQELEEKAREIERLKNLAAEVISESQDKTYNETGLLQDNSTQQNRQEEVLFDAQISPEAGRGQ